MTGATPTTLAIPVAWGEQDGFGHVNNVVYFRYFENVRMHFLGRTGILRSHREEGIGVILASTTCDFQRPVTWPETLLVSTWPDRVGRTSFVLHYRITNGAGEVVATGSSVQVLYDYLRHTKVPVPDALRALILSLKPD